MHRKNGFSLLEVLIVVSIVALLSAIGVGFYSNYGKNIGANSLAATLASDLKQAQSKSMIGDGGFRWGIHFVNVSGSNNYYEIFSTPSDYNDSGKAILSKNYLPAGSAFSDPASNSSKDIIFNKISGGIATNFSVSVVTGSLANTISVSTIGVVSIQ